MLDLTPRVLFSYAFRPFFLLIGGYALFMVLAWGLFLAGALPNIGIVSAATRHAHEMLFGFAGGAIAGFLLTAIATWTGRPPVSGWRLMALCAVWLTARLAAFMPGEYGLGLWTTASLLYWIGLLGLVSQELLAVRNVRNYKVILLLSAFLLTEWYFFYSAPTDAVGMQAALHTGVFLILGMIFLVGGRIIPNFTQNWLRVNRPEQAVQLPAFNRLDLSAVISSALFAVSFVLWPKHGLTGIVGLLAALLQALRLLRWRGWLAWREPLLWVLHLGYAWIPLGFALIALGVLRQHGGWLDSGLHALTYGAMGTLILGVAARVALGHSGRPLVASSRMTLAFVLITLGALMRITVPLGSPLILVSAGLWICAYGLFLLQYTPILLAPRLAAN